MVKKYSKTNFVEAVKIITPDVYLDEDLKVGGEQVKFTDQIINSHLVGINNISSDVESIFLHLSAIENSNSFSSLDLPVGFSRYFIKQNKLTNITPQEFDKAILAPLGTNLKSYDNANEFKAYVSSTLLPKFTLNSPTLYYDNSSVYSPTFSGVHGYFASHLSWLYFLNTSGVIFDPSSLVLDALVEKIYGGKEYKLNDAVKDYQTYVWNNYYDHVQYNADTDEYDTTAGLNSVNPAFIPSPFVSALGTYTSGTQNLEKLKTFVDILYSPLYIDRDDEIVKNAINLLLGTEGTLNSLEEAGPFHKFLRACSYLLRDLDNEVESLETLVSIQDCPVDFLPYMASLIGWKLYGNNELSWRNQLSNAVNLYKKKGTKRGLIEGLDTIIVQNPLNTSSLITELYESYIPNLLYYLLLTDSPMFNFGAYTPEVAQSYGVDLYDTQDMDVNIRACVDTILKGAMEHFPHLFILQNEPFRLTVLQNGTGYFGEVIKHPHLPDQYVTQTGEPVAILGDPKFSFRYRSPGAVHGFPPWEEEKFYKNCVVTEDLLDYYVHMLETFCVGEKTRNYFKDYVSEKVLVPPNTDLYVGNSYVFFTSSQEYAPNQDEILSTYALSSYDALTLWNGKSSTYDFTIAGGSFSSTFFQDVSGEYTIQQILDTLRIVDDFSPAKAVPRSRFILSQNEYVSGIDFMCPTIKLPIRDLPPLSGTLSNTEVSGVYDRATGCALGADIFGGYDDSRSTISHAAVPCFHRNGSLYSDNVVSSVTNTSAIVPEHIGRNTIRRRDFYNTNNKTGWFSRDGLSMPSPYFASTSSLVEYFPLGFIPSSFTFADASPENLSGVYSKDCNTFGSTRSYFDIDVSNCSLVRGNIPLSFSSCDPYVRRDLTSREIMLFFGIEEKKKKALAKDMYYTNEALFAPSASWCNFIDSIAGNMEDTQASKYEAPALDKRAFSVGSTGGIQSVYNTYNTFFGTALSFSSLPENLTVKHKHGGANILSHVYGPIYRNADFYYDGPAVLDVSSQLISRTLEDPFTINLALSGDNYADIGVATFDSSVGTDSPYWGFKEYRTNQILSGVNLVDTSATYLYQSLENEIRVYNLNQDQRSRIVTDDNYLIENQSLYIKNKSHGLPRAVFDLRGSPDLKNILIPEHDFELSVKYLMGNQDTKQFGGGGAGVVLRTKVERVFADADESKSEYVFFVWTPRQRWEMVKVDDFINGNASINTLLSNYTHKFSGGDIIDALKIGSCPLGESDDILARANEDLFQTGKIKFHTRNLLTDVPYKYGTYYSTSQPEIYNGRNNQLHYSNVNNGNKSQNYYVEIFPLPANGEAKFALFDKMGVVDTTLNEAAAVPYSGKICDYTRKFTTVDRTTFYTSDGETLDFNPFQVGSRNSPSYTDISKLNPLLYNNFWGNDNITRDAVLFQPWMYNANTMTFVKTFLQHYPDSGSESLWQTDDAPWGRIPYTGVVNRSWTTTPTGFTYATRGSGLSIENQRILLNRYWEERKGFLSMSDWCNYITVGERQDPLAPPEGEAGPGAGLYHWAQKVQLGDGAPITWQPVRPLLGFSRGGHSYTEQGAGVRSFVSTGSIGRANPFGKTVTAESLNMATLNWGGSTDNKVSIGATQEVDFTSRRRDDVGIYYPHQDPLLSTIKDPLGYVTSGSAFKNLVTIAETEDAYPWNGEDYIWSTSDIWVEEGHAITFPPMSIYRDIDRSKLIHTKPYTFSMFVATEGSLDYTKGKNFATSAILTLAPIGSKDSYTRLTLKLPKSGSWQDTVTSSIQSQGHKLTGTEAARIYVSSVNPLGGPAPLNGDRFVWYNMQVTLPYDCFELDSDDKPNLGLRCTLQAYNDEWDGNVFNEGEPPNLSYEYLPCKLYTWGSSFTASPSAVPFVRYPDTTYGLSRYSGQHWGVTQGGGSVKNYGPVYKAMGNLFEEEEFLLPRKVYHQDGQLYMYNKAASGLSKLTVAQDVKDNIYYKSKLFTSVNLYDNSGNLYDGEITLDLDRYLLRDDYGSTLDADEKRRLSVSGSTEGTNILKSVAGTIPLEPHELLHLFQYFNKLGKQAAGDALNTRCSGVSEVTHDLWGGSRLSYRVNPDNHEISLDGTNEDFGNYTKIEVNN